MVPMNPSRFLSMGPSQFSSTGLENLDHSTGKVLNKKKTTIGTVLLGRGHLGDLKIYSSGFCLNSFEVRSDLPKKV